MSFKKEVSFGNCCKAVGYARELLRGLNEFNAWSNKKKSERKENENENY